MASQAHRPAVRPGPAPPPLSSPAEKTTGGHASRGACLRSRSGPGEPSCLGERRELEQAGERRGQTAGPAPASGAAAERRVPPRRAGGSCSGPAPAGARGLWPAAHACPGPCGLAPQPGADFQTVQQSKATSPGPPVLPGRGASRHGRASQAAASCWRRSLLHHRWLQVTPAHSRDSSCLPTSPSEGVSNYVLFSSLQTKTVLSN